VWRFQRRRFGIPLRPGILAFLEDRKIAGHAAMANSMVVDRFAIYFFYLFLAATAIAILMSVRYLEPSTKITANITR
jgi:hypothetical protein